VGRTDYSRPPAEESRFSLGLALKNRSISNSRTAPEFPNTCGTGPKSRLTSLARPCLGRASGWC